MSESENKEKKNKGLGCLVNILVLVALFAGARFVSKLQINVKNLAQPFDGDISRSYFCEGETDEPFFTDDEVAELSRAVKETAQKLQINIIIEAARKPLSDEDTEDYANYNYDRICGEYTDGVFYYLDMSGKAPAYDYISTSGKAALYYEKYTDVIFYALDEYLPSSSDVQANGYEPYREGIKNGILRFLERLESFGDDTLVSPDYYMQSHNNDLYMYMVDGVYYVTKSRPPKQKFYLILFALIVGFAASKIFTASIKKKYVFVVPENPKRYIEDKDIKIEQTDKFLRENTTRRYNPPVSSSSGSGHRSGGGGGHYSGGSHGGGGHHR